MIVRKARVLVVSFSAILLCGLLGGALGPHIVAAASDGGVDENVDSFTKVLAVIEQHYAEAVDSEDVIYHGALLNMLHALDPHSQFVDPESFNQLRSEQKGHYAGVGMQIGPRNGNTVVIAPFPKTPAYRAGLRPGDVIAEVDGEAMEGLSVGEVAKNLRGPVGTKVKIGIDRRGVDGMIEVEVVRASIDYPSISSSFFIKPDVGFIKLDRFNETTGRELDDALEGFKGDRLKGLVLDLRRNRGGLLSEGVYVSDRFLEKGQVIVSHHGRSSIERKYDVKNGNRGEVYPMVVLVDCDSASASEIVAGALQDHDRALIAGTPTFGKGLVQTVFPLPETAGLLLTTARYYTPTGRLIQRSFDDVSLWKYYSDPCSEAYEPETDDVRLTDNGRRVFGGGGITPDVRLAEPKLNDFQLNLARNYAIQTFAQEYTLEHTELGTRWEATDLVIEEFRQFLYREKIEFEEAGFGQNVDYIKRVLTTEVYISAFDLDEGQRVKHSLDPIVQQALDLLPKAKQLLESAGSLVAQR